jgi:hypothetical protein
MTNFKYFGKFQGKENWASKCDALNCSDDARWIEHFGEYHIFQYNSPAFLADNSTALDKREIVAALDKVATYPKIEFDMWGNVQNCDIERAVALGCCILRITNSHNGTGGRKFLCHVPPQYPNAQYVVSYYNSEANGYDWMTVDGVEYRHAARWTKGNDTIHVKVNEMTSWIDRHFVTVTDLSEIGNRQGIIDKVFIKV